MEHVKDDRSWLIGHAEDVTWIADGAVPDGTVRTAIPAVYAAYALVIESDEPRVPDPVSTAARERAMVDVLRRHSPDQGWWLGYLETGAHDVIFDDAPRVSLYAGWHYVLVLAGPDQALTWRDATMLRGQGASLPDLLFPPDRSWLVSSLWDDSWSCVGGPGDLIDALVRDPVVRARRVDPDEDLYAKALHPD